MSQLTVRLPPEDVRVVKELRRRGVEISELVRRALRQAYVSQGPGVQPEEAMALLQEIYQRHPEPRGEGTARPDVRDRRAFAAHIRAGLRSRK